MLYFINNLILRYYKSRYLSQCHFWFQYLNIGFEFPTDSELLSRKKLIKKYSLRLLNRGYAIYDIKTIISGNIYSNLEIMADKSLSIKYYKMIIEVDNFLQQFIEDL